MLGASSFKAGCALGFLRNSNPNLTPVLPWWATILIIVTIRRLRIGVGANGISGVVALVPTGTLGHSRLMPSNESVWIETGDV